MTFFCKNVNNWFIILLISGETLKKRIPKPKINKIETDLIKISMNGTEWLGIKLTKNKVQKPIASTNKVLKLNGWMPIFFQINKNFTTL